MASYRIKKSIREHGQGQVEFSYNNFFKVTFARTKKVTKKLGEKLGERVGENLTENQNTIMKNMIKNPYISARELSGIIVISSPLRGEE